MVASGKFHASPDLLRFRDPSFFIPGSIHHSLSLWSEILHDFPNRSTFLRCLEVGVDVKQSLSLKVLFKVKFIVVLYPLGLSSPTTEAAKPFRNLSLILFWNGLPMDPCLSGGKLEKCHPLTWLYRSLQSHLSLACAMMRDSSICGSKISLFPWILLLTFPDTLTRVIFRPLATIKVVMTMFIFRQKVKPTLAMSGVVGSLFLIPPFGWKASTYLYHSIGLVATCYIRSHGVPCSQYIDDRHFGKLQIRCNAPPCSWSDFRHAQASLYIAYYILIDLGYFTGLKKSTLVPTQASTFLGYIIDSVETTFLMPPDPRCSRLSYYLCNSSSKCVGPFVFAFFPLLSLPQMFHAFGSLPPRALTGLTPTTGFNFCQNCGFQPAPPSVLSSATRVSLDLPAIDHRISCLQSTRDAKPYERQKCNLHLELESFFSSLPQVSHFCFPKRPH